MSLISSQCHATINNSTPAFPLSIPVVSLQKAAAGKHYTPSSPNAGRAHFTAACQCRGRDSTPIGPNQIQSGNTVKSNTISSGCNCLHRGNIQMKMQLGTEGRPISARIRTLKNSACFQSFSLLLKRCFCSLNKDHEQNLMPVSRTLNNRAVIKHFTTFSQ